MNAETMPSIESYLSAQENKSFLRLLTCGSVDDGKSTLIGRLLFDTKLIFEDQLSNLEKASKTYGTTGDDIDLALLVDGLEAEREQGITIDVAYRFFSSDKRKFIIADTPGHIQYTRNMVTGASTADLAILMIDARKGLVEQTQRHAFIVSMLGIKHAAVVINKMDLVDFSQDVFEEIRKNFERFAKDLSFETVDFFPLSARYGENVIARSDSMAWYEGPALLDYLNDIEVERDMAEKPFRMAVQWVNRPHLDFRGFCGTVASGIVRVGDPICVLPSGVQASVKEIVCANSALDGAEPLEQAAAGDSVTLVLDRDIDISRGDMFCAPQDRAGVTQQFSAHIIWMAEQPLYAGRPYLLKMNNKTVPVTVTDIKHKIDPKRFNQISAKSVSLNEIAVCNLSSSEPIVFDPYADNRATGGFILIDRMSNATVGTGMVKFSLYRASNVHRQNLDIDKSAHSQIKGQKPVVLWFTGLSGSGKSTIANLVEQKLHALGRHTYTLDGDNIRHGLNVDLGFTDADRVENIRRIGEVSKLMVDAGLITLVSFISPFQSERDQARSLVADGEFIEIHVNTPLEECQRRDVKGLYRKALAGEIKNFTGISSPYEEPASPELRFNTMEKDPDALADELVAYLQDKGYF